MTGVDLKLIARAEWIKTKARALGFLDCKIADATHLEDEERYLADWLNKGRHGNMDYLENHFDKRLDPRLLVPGAKSVIVLSMNYFPRLAQNPSAPKISKYAYGRDYHKVIKKRLKRFLEEMNAQFGEVHGRGFVDSAPVLEKAWARKSGLGWMGKHTNIITKQAGSFYFLAVLIVDVALAADDPVTDHCGSCTACIDACPTNAITEPYKLDASRCISYFTIELKDEVLPEAFKGSFEHWMFGCDICQDVCPWNRFSKPHDQQDFEPKGALMAMDAADWSQLSESMFDELFEGSAVKRTKYSGLMRNIRFIGF